MTKNPFLKIILDILEALAFSFAIFLVVYIFFLQPHKVDGHSMDSTLQDGEYVLTDKISYRFTDPKRGDIIVFHAPKEACYSFSQCDFIKRIIGLPGESVKLSDGYFYINGEILDEPYLDIGITTTAGNPNDIMTNDREIILGENEYLVVGDNRPNSYDSRSWGPIIKNDIIGKAFFTYWPFSEFGLIEKN